MSRGFGIFAQNVTSQGHECDYLRQAYALALSIKIHCGKDQKVFVMTNNSVSEQYAKVFDDIIEIPWGDMAENSIKHSNLFRGYNRGNFSHEL